MALECVLSAKLALRLVVHFSCLVKGQYTFKRTEHGDPSKVPQILAVLYVCTYFVPSNSVRESIRCSFEGNFRHQYHNSNKNCKLLLVSVCLDIFTGSLPFAKHRSSALSRRHLQKFYLEVTISIAFFSFSFS